MTCICSTPRIEREGARADPRRFRLVQPTQGTANYAAAFLSSFVLGAGGVAGRTVPEVADATGRSNIVWAAKDTTCSSAISPSENDPPARLRNGTFADPPTAIRMPPSRKNRMVGVNRIA